MINLQDFIATHERALSNFALQLTHSEDEKDDLLQDIWLKSIVNQSKLSSMTEQNQRSWLFTVLKNRWLDICRHRKLERLHLSQYDPSPATQFTNLLMDFHLEKLSEVEQHIVKEKFWMGSNSRQIAEDLGIPEGTVRWRLKIAMQKLKESVEQSDKEERCLL